jgi:hypothetical protein
VLAAMEVGRSDLGSHPRDGDFAWLAALLRVVMNQAPELLAAADQSCLAAQGGDATKRVPIFDRGLQ